MWLVTNAQNEPKPGIQLVNKLQALTGHRDQHSIGPSDFQRSSARGVRSYRVEGAIEWETTKFERETGIRCRLAWA